MKDDVSNLLAAVAQLQSSNLDYISSLGNKGKEILGKVEWGNIVGNIQLQQDLIDLVNSIKDAIETEIGSVFEYKGQVNTVNALPNNAKIGDCYNVSETDANYVYNGSSWDKLSESYDFSQYALKSDLEGFATEDELDNLATKAELAELQALYYTKEAVDQLINTLSLSVDEKLASKVDNADLDNYYTKTATDNKLNDKANTIDLETEITNRQNNEGKLISKIWSNSNLDTGHFYSKLTNAKSGYALIFNESDGGGAQVFDKTANVISYVGANLEEGEGDKESAVNVQIYSKDKTTNEGVRININPNKAFYLKGGNKTNIPARELVVKEDIAGLDTNVANINALISRIDVLEDKVNAIKKTNIEPISSETSINVSDNTKDYIVTGNITEQSTIISKSTNLKDVEIDAAVVNITASDDVDLKNVEISGTYNKSTQGNAISSIHSDGYISIKDCVISATGYNSIEIGLGTGLVKSVLIDNVDFSGKFTNNAISIFGTQEDAVITISNCHFEDVSNVLRISNRTNTKCTINVINCTCDKWDQGDYAGLIIFQDYTSTTSALAEENNLFGDGKITLNIQNLIKPDGNKLEVPDNIADICGSGNNQILYVYRDKGGLVPYNADKFPAVNIL